MTQIPIEEGPPETGGDGREAAGEESPGGEETPVEEQLERLDEIVQKLESESVSLDESIALFEEGVELAVRVRKRLEASEGRIKRIIEKSEGLFSLEDFDLD